jgi:hypothetical protein
MAAVLNIGPPPPFFFFFYIVYGLCVSEDPAASSQSGGIGHGE